ncbi:hypothetical protein Tco_0424072 [Tanacetum coccineum]
MKVYALGLRERMELDLEARLMDRSRVLEFGDYIELNDLNEPLELRNHDNEDLGPTIDEGEVIDELNRKIVKTKNNNVMKEKIDEEVCVDARRSDRLITIYNGNSSVTYQMARTHPRFKHLSNEQCNKIWPLLKVNARDKLEGKSHPYQILKGFYKGVLKLELEYIKDEKTGLADTYCMNWWNTYSLEYSVEAVRTRIQSRFRYKSCSYT